MLDLLIFISLLFFICLISAAVVIAVGILIIMHLKDAQRKKKEDERKNLFPAYYATHVHSVSLLLRRLR